jgi:CrcB protein
LTPAGFLAVGIGAAFGAWLRWAFSAWFNPVFPNLPLGTLAANLVGGFLIGVAVEYFLHYPTLTPEVRLFAITGFLGGLTTFSTFSAEAVHMLQRAQWGWAAALIGSHLAGSIVATIAGMALMRALR